MKFVFAIALSLGLAAQAAPKVDAAAPSFSEKDANGKTFTEKDFQKKWTVLEWYNKDCPYVKKHYKSNNMQALQEEFTKKGVQWITVISSAEGEQGYLAPADALKDIKASNSKATALLIDADGSMGHAYDAKTTPHMYVVDPTGKLVYAGAIDSNDSSDPKTIAKSENYVKAALNAGMSGSPIAKKTSTAYGCSIKYKN